GTHERLIVTRKDTTRFTNFYSRGGVLARPSWSADGQTLMVIGSNAAADRNRRHQELVMIDVTSGKERQVVPVPRLALAEASWLTSSRVLVNATQGNRAPALYTVDLTSGEATQVTQELAAFAGASLTADHQTAVTTRFDAKSSVWMGDADGSHLKEVIAE